MDDEYGGHYYVATDGPWDRQHLFSIARQSAEKSNKPQLIHLHQYAEPHDGKTHLVVPVSEQIDPYEVEYQC